jgi:hypothetical protein
MHVINFIPPGNIDTYGNFSLHLNHALSKILSIKKHSSKPVQIAPLIKTELFAPNRQFKDRNVSIKKTVYILAQNKIDVAEEKASIILDFLYLVAKFSRPKDKMPHSTLSGNRTLKMKLKPSAVHENRPDLETV